MGSTTTDKIKSKFKFNYDNRLQELKAFDETKAGVKGLVDQGISQNSILISPST
jgi:hypothetical protein